MLLRFLKLPPLLTRAGPAKALRRPHPPPVTTWQAVLPDSRAVPGTCPFSGSDFGRALQAAPVHSRRARYPVSVLLSLTPLSSRGRGPCAAARVRRAHAHRARHELPYVCAPRTLLWRFTSGLPPPVALQTRQVPVQFARCAPNERPSPGARRESARRHSSWQASAFHGEAQQAGESPGI